ncbi:DUF4365 domain-containing protein [Emticicia sp. C21]|uniref:DUF4365 domain-containing protein n=1 Tax=Emticicia sp. C21 TaxID=2302915 RepID=UPI000E34B67E|nr:DUF4365 domain-containing protein [Emticicia sp. C21]RFS16604.1 DUF4365 domain-containing protein [Emticicia sp. C21]
MTSRNLNIKTEQQGVRYIQGIVQDNNSIFQNINRENDQGNDCYIEFVENGYALNYGIFAQIKSGMSYRDNQGYKIPTDKAHLKYWSQGLNLSIGIVYDPELQKAYWVDITAYIKANNNILNQEYHAIRIDTKNEFSQDFFPGFMKYCIDFREEFNNYENYGRSLDAFADLDNPNNCYEGLKSLYSNHRDKQSTWFYIISTFSKIKHEGIQRNIIGLLSNYTYQPYIFYSNSKLLPSEEIREKISELMTKYFRKEEVELTLKYMENGIIKGSFSYLVFLVINFVSDIHIIFKDISFSVGIDDDKRNFCFWLYIHLAKFHSIEETIKTTELFLSKFPIGYKDEAMIGVIESIKIGQLWPVG